MTPSAAGYRGAHPEDAVRSADVDTMRRLLDAVTGEDRLSIMGMEVDIGEESAVQHGVHLRPLRWPGDVLSSGTSFYDLQVSNS